MPNRRNGYVSKNFQRDWSVDPKEDTLKVTTDVELDVGDKVIIDTEIPKISKPESKSVPKKKNKK